MKFNYQARTKKGDIYRGSIESSSKDSAISLLRERGFYPTFLEEEISPFYSKRIKLFERITKKDLVLFSRQLAIMFKSNISLIESLRVLADQIDNLNFKEKIMKISEDVEGGTAFSKALARYPKIFSLFYISVIESGETSGKLSESLDYLANHLEREFHLTAKIRGALVYPMLVVFVIFIVLVLLIFFVLPNLIEIFEAGNQTLPLATRMVIALTNWLRSWWWLLLLGLVSLIFFLFKYRSTENGRKFFDRMFLKLPIIGPFLQMIYLDRFAENFSTLVSSGLPIIQSLEIIEDIVGNFYYQEAISKAKEAIGRGEMISSALSQSPNLFPPIFVRMALVGEKTGKLSSTLMSIVSFYQKEIDRSIENILSVLEPILIVFLGVVVAGILLSVLMPLYQMAAF